jgi:hypothetical protein
MEIKKKGLPSQRYIGLKVALLWRKKILNFCNFSKKWNGNVARIVFCHCGYEGCYVLNKIKVLQEERILFLSIFRAPLGPSLPRSEFGIREF